MPKIAAARARSARRMKRFEPNSFNPLFKHAFQR